MLDPGVPCRRLVNGADAALARRLLTQGSHPCVGSRDSGQRRARTHARLSCSRLF